MLNNSFANGQDIITKIKLKRGNVMKNNMGLMIGGTVGVMMLVAVGAMLSNTKAARRRRMMRKAMKTVHNVGCAMQKMTSF